MKNEAKARLEIMLNAQPAASPTPVPSAPAAERREHVDSPFLTVCLEELRRMNGNEKSNPIVLAPAA